MSSYDKVNVVVHQCNSYVFNWAEEVVGSESANLGETVSSLEEFIALWIWFLDVLGKRSSREPISILRWFLKSGCGDHLQDCLVVSANVVTVKVTVFI